MKKGMIVCLVAGLSVVAFGGQAPHAEVDPEQLLPPAAEASRFTAQTHPLYETFNTYLDNQSAFTEGLEPTGLDKEEYLRLINGVVLATRPFQVLDPEHEFYGEILDPWHDPGHYHYYATPHYAYCAAVLAASGYNTDPELLKSAILAYEVSIERMVQGRRDRDLGGRPPWVCGDFYTYSLMRALPYFNKLLDEEQYRHWRERLAAIEPEKAYMQRMTHNNWSVKNGASEFLRAAAGLTDMDWTERTLALHRVNFSDHGTFRPEPFTYDVFPRYYLSGMLQAGYRGNHFDFYRDRMWRGAWLTLFLVTPQGQAAAGSRSMHHCWNEAQLCAMYELYATAYANAGRMEEAGLFKRAARLALRSMAYWINDDGSFAVVKHRLGPDLPKGRAVSRHAYEAYTEHTTYNLLAASMLAGAWATADDSIPERPAPADVGGFAFRLDERYQTWFLGARDTYVQYAVPGNGTYDPTGLTRIHFKGTSPIFAPSAGLARRFGDNKSVYSTGPGWRDAAGEDRSIAEFLLDSTLRVVEAAPERTVFETRYEVTGASTIPAGAGRIGGRMDGGAAGEASVHFASMPGYLLADELVPVGQGDFFFTARVRTGEMRHPQTLFTVYRSGDWHLFTATLFPDYRLSTVYRCPPQKIGGVHFNASLNALADGNWHHVAVGRSSGEVQVWLNGELVGKQQAPALHNEPLHIAFGRFSHESSRLPWRGGIRHMQFFDRALSGEEIRQLAEGQGMEGNGALIDWDLAAVEVAEPVRVVEQVEITPGAVEMTLTFDGPTQLNRFIYPVITDDGREKIRFTRTGNAVLTELPSEPGRGARIQVLEPEGLELELRDLRLEHPNGFMGILQAETPAPRIRVRIEED